MVKPRLILITSGILVLIGIALTAYQSQMTAENLSNQQMILGNGKQMIITKQMDPNKNQKGVYSVQITDFKNDDNIKVLVTDPAGISIITKSITKNPIQENFKVAAFGNYTLQIENQGHVDIQVLGIIGYYPEGIELADISGFIALMVGLGGLAIGLMYIIRNRVKPQT
jgi:hypothetical protein